MYGLEFSDKFITLPKRARRVNIALNAHLSIRDALSDGREFTMPWCPMQVMLIHFI